MDSIEEFTLGTNFVLELGPLADNLADYTVQQVIAALEATTTLTTLFFLGRPDDFYEDEDDEPPPPPISHRRVLEPLCRCLANLRLQNEHHPLQNIQFFNVDSDVVLQFLVPMKQFGIRNVNFLKVEPFPVHLLMDFCHDNSHLKVLELRYMTFTDEDVAHPSGGSASTTLNLDKLIVQHIFFRTSFSTTNFAQLLAHMSVSALQLGKLFPSYNLEMHEDLNYLFDKRDDEFTKLIGSGFKMISVEELTLDYGCRSKLFQAAMDAGMATVTRLRVEFSDEDEPEKKMESLTRIIQGAVKLKSLTIQNYVIYGRSQLSPPRPLFQALEACASVTEIHVNNSNRHDFTESEVRQLHRITARNSELGQFMANPITFPNDKLLSLMRQFNDCPSGLYMLARRVPEAFSFATGNSLFPLMDPTPTRKLRKRRKISYTC